jgi:predicted aspartyl protease
MPAYNEDLFSPPAPVVSAKLRNPESGATRDDILLLIDSGADVTLLPKSAVEALGIQSTGAYELIGFDGGKSLADVVRADLLFLNKTFRGQFLLGNQDIGILGRDVLNSLAIVLDGPRLVWEARPAHGASR